MSVKDSRITFVLLSIALVLASGLVAIRIASLVEPAIPSPAQRAGVQLIDTPEYNACDVSSVDSIKAAGQENEIATVKTGLRYGDYAPNNTIADGCSFELSTKKTSNLFLTVQAYDYTATIDGKDKESVDDSWRAVEASNPIAYFKQNTVGETTFYTLRAIPGGKNVIFELQQPAEDKTFDEKTALQFLKTISSKADFNVIDVESSIKAKD